MADPLRHRQTNGAATDMVDLRPPRHIPTLPIGIFVSFKDFPRIALSPAEWFFLALAIVLFLYSIRTGLTILNALPGAMQRVPANASAQGADVFSIANENDSRTLDVLSKHVRNSFLAGMASFVAFVIVRAALSTPLPPLLD
jgi:hypothetical protein